LGKLDSGFFEKEKHFIRERKQKIFPAAKAVFALNRSILAGKNNHLPVFPIHLAKTSSLF